MKNSKDSSLDLTAPTPGFDGIVNPTIDKNGVEFLIPIIPDELLAGPDQSNWSLIVSKTADKEPGFARFDIAPDNSAYFKVKPENSTSIATQPGVFAHFVKGKKIADGSQLYVFYCMYPPSIYAYSIVSAPAKITIKGF